MVVKKKPSGMILGMSRLEKVLRGVYFLLDFPQVLKNKMGKLKKIKKSSVRWFFFFSAHK